MKQTNSKQVRKYSHLSLEEREEIAIALENGLKQSEIAIILSRPACTISRELRRNNSSLSKVRYRASWAQYKANKRKENSHMRQRLPNKRLRRFIRKKIMAGYSPEIVAFMVSKKNNHWKTNYETIYQWIYNDSKDLVPFLVKGHKKRRKRGSAKQKRCPKVPNRIMIEHRPEYVNLRSYIGHWETDTIISRQSKEAVMILVERKARYTIIKKLAAKTAFSMHKAIVESLKGFHHSKRQSITYDNGTENSLHEITNNALGTRSYFCNPYHSWEKGTVENIIGIVRRFYPKKTNWKNITQWDLNKIASFINNRPMKLLGFKTPYQVFVALTA
jgi:IS30 family transposase